MKLLIADDEEIIRHGLLRLPWQEAGVSQVLTAESGTAAQDILKESNIDILLSDIWMPGLTGLDLAEYLSAHSCETKVILLTGFSDFAFAQTALRCGVADYLLKPVDPDSLMKAVRKAGATLQLERERSHIVSQHKENPESHTFRQQILNGFVHLGQPTQEILAYLAEAYAQQISLGCLEEKYHFSAIHISRTIKKDTGYSFISILTGIRLIASAKFLREPHIRVGEAGIRAGFRDPRYFSQVFKRTFGCSPQEYRRLQDSPKNYTLLELLEKMQEQLE